MSRVHCGFPPAPSPHTCYSLETERETMTQYIDVDVRPILRSGGEPFSAIMATLARLEPGQGLRLYATFKPLPLFAVMADKGFTHSEQPLDGGEWEVLFTPAEAVSEQTMVPTPTLSSDTWPEPTLKLDNRDLDPPKPKKQNHTTTKKKSPRETHTAKKHREPVFLFPQLEKRGFR